MSLNGLNAFGSILTFLWKKKTTKNQYCYYIMDIMRIVSIMCIVFIQIKATDWIRFFIKTIKTVNNNLCFDLFDLKDLELKKIEIFNGKFQSFRKVRKFQHRLPPLPPMNNFWPIEPIEPIEHMIFKANELNEKTTKHLTATKM